MNLRLRAMSSRKVIAIWACLLAAPALAEPPRPLTNLADPLPIAHWSMTDVSAKPLTSYPAGQLWEGFCCEPLFFCHPCYRSDCTELGQCGNGLSGTCQACLSSYGGPVSGSVSASSCHGCQTKVRVGNLAPVVKAQPPAAGRRAVSGRTAQPSTGQLSARRTPGQLSPADLVELSAPATAQWVEGIPEGQVASHAPSTSAIVGNPFIDDRFLEPSAEDRRSNGKLLNGEAGWFVDPQVQPAAAFGKLSTTTVKVDPSSVAVDSPAGSAATRSGHAESLPATPAAAESRPAAHGAFDRLRSQLQDLAR